MQDAGKPIVVEVTNPHHYAGDDNVIEPIDRIGNVPFSFGSAFKYLKRLGLKGGENTESRDAAAAIWYCLDLMHRLLDEDGNAYIPTPEEYEAFDLTEYYKDVAQHDWAVARELGLVFAGCPRKITALASMDRLIQQSQAAVKIGMAEWQYREFVFHSLMAGWYVIRYALAFKPDGVNYVGSKSYKPSETAQLALADFYRRYEAVHGIGE